MQNFQQRKVGRGARFCAALVAVCAGACTTIEPIPQCFATETYSSEFLQKAYTEAQAVKLESLAPSLTKMLQDYKKVYDKEKACQEVAKTQ